MTPLDGGVTHAMVDLDVVRRNTELIAAHVRPTSVIATVKADAYGLGALRVAKAALAGGAMGVATGDLESALALRDSGVGGQILVFPVLLSPEGLREAVSSSLVLTVCDPAEVPEWDSWAPSRIRVFAKCRLGLERLGTTLDELDGVLESIRASRHVTLSGLLGHLHCPEGAPRDYVQWQLDTFSRCLDRVAVEGNQGCQGVVAASALLRRSDEIEPDPRLTAVDPGSLLTGIVGVPPGPLDRIERALEAVSTRILQVHDLNRSDYADQAPFALDAVARVGVLPIGLSLGFDRIHAGAVLVHGRRARVLRNWTEHTVIDLTGISAARAGDEAVIIGDQGEDTIKVADVLRHQPNLAELDLALTLRAVPKRYRPPLAARGGDS